MSSFPVLDHLALTVRDRDRALRHLLQGNVGHLGVSRLAGGHQRLRRGLKHFWHWRRYERPEPLREGQSRDGGLPWTGYP